MCYKLGDQTNYALEGAVEIAGAALEWTKSIGLFKEASEVEPEARTVEDNGDTYFVPAFNGIFSPYWRDDARGMIIGISSHTKKGHLARALMEAPCFRTDEVVSAMAKDSGIKVTSMAVDGGLSVSNLCMQTQADIADVEIVRK